jgi:hypothetical protein
MPVPLENKPPDHSSHIREDFVVNSSDSEGIKFRSDGESSVFPGRQAYATWMALGLHTYFVGSIFDSSVVEVF